MATGGQLPIFPFGALIRVSALFLDSSGTATDPGTIKFKYENLTAGVVTTTITYPTTIVKDATGKYHIDVDSNEGSGKYRWQFFSVTTGTASTFGDFYVSPSGFTV